MRGYLLVFTLILLRCAGESPSTPLQMPALLSPEVKLDPVSGEVIGENGQTIGEAGFLNLLDQNKSLSVTAFFGETLCFQLVIPSVPRLYFIEKATVALETEIFQVGVVRPRRDSTRYYPDLLVPVRKASPGKGGHSVTDARFFPPESRYSLYWIDIHIPESAGKSPEDARIVYSLCLTDSNAFTDTVSIRLHLHKKPLPPPPLLLDWNEYGDKYLRLLKWNLEYPRLLEKEVEIFRLARAHHAVLNMLPYRSQQGGAIKRLTPRVVNDDLLNPQLDWEAFDRRFEKYLDGSAFENNRPLHHLYLPFNPNWPAPFSLFYKDRNRYERIWEAFAREFIHHFQEKGWTKTRFEVYCNQKPRPNNTIPWNLDEPKGTEDYQALRYYADLTHRVFENKQQVFVQFRIDIAHFFCDEHRGLQNKDFRVNWGDTILAPVDKWVISQHSLKSEYATRQAQKLRQQGKEVWVYGDTPLIIEPGYRAFSRIYTAWEKGWDGFLVWKTFLRSLDDIDGKRFVVYPLSVDGQPGYYPSLRMKLLRRAIDDLRILELFRHEENQETFRVARRLLNAYARDGIKSAQDFREFLLKLSYN